MNANLLSSSCTLTPFPRFLNSMFHRIRLVSLTVGLLMHVLAAVAQEAESIPQVDLPLSNLTADEISRLTLQDSKLKTAYTALFLRRYGHAAWHSLVAADLKRRGNEAIPLLLELFDENPESAFREELLFSLHEYPSIDSGPILGRIRQMVKTGGAQMSRRTYASLCSFLAKSGTIDDVKILESFITHDPKGEIGWTASRNLTALRKRLASQSVRDEPDRQARKTNSSLPDPMEDAKLAPTPKAFEGKSSPSSYKQPPKSPWGIIIVLIVVASGLLWLVLKRRS